MTSLKDLDSDDPKITQDLDDSYKSKEKLEVLEEWLRAIEGTTKYGFMDTTELCLIPDVVMPLKFKVLEFEKFNGFTCLMNHLLLNGTQNLIVIRCDVRKTLLMPL